jgi:hypothetical protein
MSLRVSPRVFTVIALASVAALPPNVMPVLSRLIADVHGLDEAQLGYFVASGTTAGLLAAATAPLWIAAIGARVRELVIACLAAYAICVHALALVPGPPLLYALQFLLGGCAVVVASACAGFLMRQANPGRAMSVKIGSDIVVASAFLYLLPISALPLAGFAAALSACFVAGALLAVRWPVAAGLRATHPGPVAAWPTAGAAGAARTAAAASVEEASVDAAGGAGAPMARAAPTGMAGHAAEAFGGTATGTGATAAAAPGPAPAVAQARGLATAPAAAPGHAPVEAPVPATNPALATTPAPTPAPGAAPADGPAGAGASPRGAGWAVLAAMVVFYVAGISGWNYLGRLAAHAGLDADRGASAIAAGLLVGVIGAVGAASLSGRTTRIWPQVTAGVAFVASVAWLGQATTFVSYLAAVLVFNVAWNFYIPFVMALLAARDPGGRLSTLIPATAMLGGVVGPPLTGNLMQAVGYGFAMGVLALAGAVSVAGYAWLATRQRPGIHGAPDAAGETAVLPQPREGR